MVDGRRSWRISICLSVLAMAIVAVALSRPATASAADPTTTEVQCRESAVVHGKFDCDVFVQNTAAGRAPRGVVHFVDQTQGGLFTPDTCSLVELVNRTSGCSVTYTAVSLGSREIEAVYDPTGVETLFQPSTGTTPISHRAITLATLDCSPLTVAVDHVTHCEIFMLHLAEVTESNHVPSGRVAFAALNGSGTFGPASFCDLQPRGAVTSSCSVDFTPRQTVGIREIVTLYLGDDFNEGTRFRQEGTGAVIVVEPRSAGVTVSCQPERVGLNQPSSCRAKVVDEAPDPRPVSGTIQFERDPADGDGSFSEEGECELVQENVESSSCEIEYTPTARGDGAHEITASYSGDSIHDGSSGADEVLVGSEEEEAEANKSPTVTTVLCRPNRLATSRTSLCIFTVEGDGSNPTPVTGSLNLTSDGEGEFSGESCLLQESGPARARCEVAYVPTAVGSGSHKITAEYGGDDNYRKSRGEAALTVGSIRFAAPGGTGADPCADRTNPCSFFTAADLTAPGTTVKAGDEVILTPGLYTSAAGDLGPRGRITLAANVDVHGERRLPRPEIEIAPEVVGFFGLSIPGGTVVSHLEAKSSTEPVVILSSGVLEDVIVRGSANGALACSQADGVIRDSACLASGANATAVGLVANGPIFRSLRLRNVTAVSTGSNSVGLRYSARGGSLEIDAKSVIARGTATDAVARGLSNPFDPEIGGEVQVAFDHSDYATTSATADAGGFATVTPAGSGTNIVAAPRLAADQVHQLVDSPTIDAGVTDEESGVFDIDGEPRTGDGAPDIGADEFVASITETDLTCEPDSVQTDTPTTCTATVTAEAPAAQPLSGEVEFQTDDPGSFSAERCELQGEGNQLSCAVDYTPDEATPALHHLNATYKGTSEYAPSSDSFDLSVTEPGGGNQQETSTELFCEPDSVETDEQSHCIATVTGQTSAPAGEVRFSTEDPGTFAPVTCELENPDELSATCAVDYTPSEATPALHLLRATYTGTTDHAPSEDSFELNVTEEGGGGNQQLTSTELLCEPDLVEVNDSSHCTVTVTGAEQAPSGEVRFSTEDPGAFAPIVCELQDPVDNSASCAVDYTPAEATPALHLLKATYTGTSADAPSEGTFELIVTEEGGGNQQETTTELLCEPDPVETNHQSHCTATVTGAVQVPTGEVRFSTADPGTFAPVTCELENPDELSASCAVDYTPSEATPALHLLRATYTGTTDHAPSEDSFELNVTEEDDGGGGGGGGDLNPTTTTLACGPDDVILGGGSVCTAIVEDTATENRSAPTGVVELVTDSPGDFSNPCILAPIGPQTARCQVVYEPDQVDTGVHGIFAEYEGDDDHDGSEAEAQIAVADPAGGHETAMALECEPATVILGGISVCTVNVRDLDPNPTVPGGAVFFASDAGGDFSTGGCLLFAVAPGESRCQLIYTPSQVGPGAHTIRAIYPGNASHEPSINSDLIDVEPPNGGHQTTTTLECGPVPVAVGDAATCTATVTDEDDDTADPTRAVVFASDSPGDFDLGGCQLEPPNGDGQASCQFTYRPLQVGEGVHKITAAYEGDPGHEPSPAVSVEVDVIAANPPGPPPPGPGQNPANPNPPVPPKVNPPPPPTAAAPPNTVLKKKPRKKTAKRKTKFKFVSDQPGSSFQCKLDKKPFKACRSPWKKKVKPGRHTFQVRAINAQGIADPTPAVFKWTVGGGKR
jgi:large repetitive protein